MPVPPSLDALFALGPLPVRVIAGGAGLLLLFGGSRLYKLAVVLPGVLLGLGAALLGARALSLDPMPTLIAAGVLALGGGIVAHLVERAALRVAGVVAGIGVLQVGAPLVAAHPPWWGWLVAAGLGALVLPLIWGVAVAPITAVLGAFVLADVAGYPGNPAIVIGAAVVGTVAQWGFFKGRRKEA